MYSQLLQQHSEIMRDMNCFGVVHTCYKSGQLRTLTADSFCKPDIIFTSTTKSKTHKTMKPRHISTIARGSRIPLERTAIRKIIHPKPNWFAFLYTTLGSSVFDGFVSGLTAKSDKRIKQRWPEAYQFYTSTETYLLFSRIYIS